MPLPSGSRTSRMATSGRVGGIRASASADGCRLSDDDDVVGGLEQRPEPGADDLMVVEKEDPDAQLLILIPWHLRSAEATSPSDAPQMALASRSTIVV